MDAISAVGAGAAQMGSGFEIGLPPEAQLVIVLLSLGCAAWLVSLALPAARWREGWAVWARRFARRRAARGAAGLR